MKEETKSKLKKVGKRAGFGLALVSLFLLGVGVGACSARKAVGSSAESLTSSDVAPNLLDNGTLFEGRIIQLRENDFINISSQSWAYSYCVHKDYLQGTRFVLTFDGSYSQDDLYDAIIGAVSSSVYQVLGTQASQTYPFSGFWKSEYPLYFGASPYFFEVAPDFFDDTYEYLYLRSPVQITGLYLVTEENYYSFLPSLETVSFPDDYNPLAGFGNSSDGLIGQIVGNGSSPFRLDLYFRSGGQVFKRIDFYFLPMQGMSYVSALSSSGSPLVFSGTGFVYGSMINYIALDGTTFLAWRAVFGVTSDGTTYLRNFGEWLSKQYQKIDVLQYTPVLGQSGVAPNLDQVGILELRTASGVPTPVIGGDSNADVFSLLATGFNSVAGLMNIQILPFLTLGTLIFVPLVVMVIFAILKVLNK